MLEIDINLSFVTWELCNWSSDRDLLVVTWCLPDASWCFETIFFWKFSAYLKISSFFSFLYVLLSCSHFYFFLFFSPENHLKASCCFLLHPLPVPSYFSFPPNFPNVHLLNSWSKLMKRIWFSLSRGKSKMARHWSDQNLCHRQLYIHLSAEERKKASSRGQNNLMR